MRIKNHKGSGTLHFKFLKQMDAGYTPSVGFRSSGNDVSITFHSEYVAGNTNSIDLEGTLKSNDGKHTYDVAGIFNPATQCFEIRIFDSNN